MSRHMSINDKARIDSRSGGSKLGMISFPSLRDGSKLGMLEGTSHSMDHQVFDSSNNRDLNSVSTSQVSVESASITEVIESSKEEGSPLPNFASVKNIRSEHIQTCAVYCKAYARQGLTVPTWSRNIDNNRLDVVVGKLHHQNDCNCNKLIASHNVQTGIIIITKQASDIGIHPQQAFFVHSTQWDENDVHTSNWISWE
jgi:hypothetical protein